MNHNIRLSYLKKNISGGARVGQIGDFFGNFGGLDAESLLSASKFWREVYEVMFLCSRFLIAPPGAPLAPKTFWQLNLYKKFIRPWTTTQHGRFQKISLAAGHWFVIGLALRHRRHFWNYLHYGIIAKNSGPRVKKILIYVLHILQSHSKNEMSKNYPKIKVSGATLQRSKMHCTHRVIFARFKNNRVMGKIYAFSVVKLTG